MSEISTRNLFAAAALQGLLGGREGNSWPSNSDVDRRTIAQRAFEIADEMEKRTDEWKAEASAYAIAQRVAKEMQHEQALPT